MVTIVYISESEVDTYLEIVGNCLWSSNKFDIEYMTSSEYGEETEREKKPHIYNKQSRPLKKRNAWKQKTKQTNKNNNITNIHIRKGFD